MLDTVGGQVAELGLDRAGWVVFGLWVVVVAKLVAAVLPLMSVPQLSTRQLAAKPVDVSRLGRRGGREGGRRWTRLVRGLTWVEVVVLVGYGGVLTAVGLAVQAGVIATSPDADHRALAWHAFFWDPWFLLWGLAALIALLASRRRPSAPVPQDEGV